MPHQFTIDAAGESGVLPMLLSAVAGCVFIDRVGRRRLSAAADLASAVCVAAGQWSTG
ncbi:hypothetical protein [Streptomyces sp. NPDC002845]